VCCSATSWTKHARSHDHDTAEACTFKAEH
jgi:hypothetical protein